MSIRTISEMCGWGGDKCLDKIDWNTKTITSYELCGGARFMARDDSLHFWLSTNNDIYRVNVLDGKLDVLDKPARCRNVNDILCTENGNLYIATSDEGLFVRDSIGRFLCIILAATARCLRITFFL